MPLTGRNVRAALAAFRQFQTTPPAAGAGTGSSESTSVRLTVAEPPEDVTSIPSKVLSKVLSNVLAGPVSRLLGAAAVDRLDTRLSAGTVEIDLGQALPPEVSSRVLPLLAGLGGVVLLEASDGGRPGQLLRSAGTRLVGVVSRADLDVIASFADPTAPTPTAEQAGPAGPPPAEFGPLHIKPFRPNARPIDEVDLPGSGCSEAVGLVGSGADEEETLWILFGLDRLAEPAGRVEVRMSASFVPTAGSGLPAPVSVPGLSEVPVPGARVSKDRHPQRFLEPAPFEPGDAGAFVAALAPRRDLLPSQSGWSWEEAEPALRDATPDGRDPFTFAHLFKQRVRVDLGLDIEGARAASRSVEIDVFDLDRFGSLYERLITQLVCTDTQQQAATLGMRRVYQAYHPWYPVLAIGLAKARLYLRAIREDVAWQRRNLADPGWLMRVGLYLELLTCLGIMEAVKDEYPHLLTDAEWECFRRSPAYQEIRRRIKPSAWRRVWAQRRIEFAANPLTAAGPVDFRNLIRKESANLAFLHAHHDDLKHAIELAGPNLEGSQQTWHRVFRDAERAVLDASHSVFPEFRHLGAAPYAFVLWHQQGKFSLPASGLLPSWLTAIFGDRDGLYPTAARRYRGSMNEVAEWARQRGLMDYTGEECIPRSASLIEARLDGEDERYATLQGADGYGPAPSATRQHLAHAAASGVEVVASLLRTIEIFEPLSVSEIWRLAYQCERRSVRPGEAVLSQGQPASALYLIERGTVEVIARQPDGSELAVDRMGSGDVFGEYSLLTGQPTSATVRALDQVVVHVMPKSALQPIIQARPDLVVELSVLLAARRGNRQSRSEEYLFGSSEPPNAGMVARLVSRMRDYLLT